jgi:hypothetical protein
MSIAAAASPVVDSLALDGVVLEFRERRRDAAYFYLDLTRARCADCVVPREMLEQMLLARVRTAYPDIESVVVEDPREGEDSVR